LCQPEGFGPEIQVEIFQAIVLALIQGLTEFLPISSSAHLVLVPRLLGWVDQGLAFDVAVHVGTLLAVLSYLRSDLVNILSAWFSGWSQLCWDQEGLTGWFVIVATIPVGLVGLAGSGWIEFNLRDPILIAAATLIFGLLLGWADRHGDRLTRTIGDLKWRDTLLIGLAQALAVIPGTSRSGITMTMGLMLGLSRHETARFSFLLSVPAIALPGLLKTSEMIRADTVIHWEALAIGVAVSAVTAFLCIEGFMRFVAKVGMKPFVIYRVLLALVLFALFS
jgi:undecaprenyl-diphosphatase